MWRTLQSLQSLGTVIYFIPPKSSIRGKRGIAAFDLGETLLHKTDHGWKWTFSEVPEILTELDDDGWILAVFSNHPRMSDLSDVKGRIEEMMDELGFPLYIFVSIGSHGPGGTSKPNIIMWDLFLRLTGVVPDESSFFVGNKGTDRKFAHNAGLRFFSPMEFFLAP